MYDPFKTELKLKQQDHKLVEIVIAKSIKDSFQEQQSKHEH